MPAGEAEEEAAVAEVAEVAAVAAEAAADLEVGVARGQAEEDSPGIEAEPEASLAA